MLRIYPSSRYNRAQMWIDFAQKYKLHYVAQWITHFEYGDMTDSPMNAELYWQDNLRDIKDCDLLIAYGEHSDVLGGCLIEVGAALAYGKKVALVGENTAFRCWRYHPLVVSHCATLSQALYLNNLLPDQVKHKTKEAWDWKTSGEG